VPCEIIVVDSGSRDDTLAIAEAFGVDQVLSIEPRRFSYGATLNLGAEAAHGHVHAALSSHCSLPREDWFELSLHHFDDPSVAAVNGQVVDPSGTPLTAPFRLTAETPVADPYWGFSNHASSWRRSVWLRHPFDERLIASEDLDWADRVCADGGSVIFDPQLIVPGDHRYRESPKQMYRRAWRESMSVTAIRGTEFPGLASTLREWWFAIPPGTKPHRQRLSPIRVTTLAARYLVGREVRRRGTSAAYVVPEAE
jgi:glycosyltransferase involved in cell wall biosynthesis